MSAGDMCCLLLIRGGLVLYITSPRVKIRERTCAQGRSFRIGSLESVGTNMVAAMQNKDFWIQLRLFNKLESTEEIVHNKDGYITCLNLIEN